MEYDVKGNITKKGDIGGQFYYNTPNKPYAVSGLDAGTNPSVPPRNQNVTYTSFERPLTITENGYVATFTYDGSGNRHKMQLTKNGSSELTRYYLGDCYETDVTTSGTKQRLYLNGDAYSAPAVYVNSGSGWQLYYICRDYQGSITHIVNSTGILTQELSYDAWGRLRNPSTQEAYLPDNEPTLFLGRGYTGHEHLTQFGLINMNARLYDPALGRFLAPDPYVQAPDFSQNFNRYSYCLNNPLIYSDEDGEWIQIVIGAVIGGVVNWATHGCQFNAKGLGYFGVGAAAGAVGGWAGGAVSGAVGTVGFAGGAMTGAADGFAGGFVGGAGNSWVGGSSFVQGLGQGLTGGCIGAATGGLISGVSGGITAIRHNGDFWSGEGSIFEQLGKTTSVYSDVQVGEGMEYSNEYARNFSDEYYGSDIKGVNNLYADGITPSGYKTIGGITYNSKGNIVNGLSRNLGIGKGSDVYLFKTAFTSKEQLYLTMGHEYLHAAFNNVGLLSGKYQHASIYKWETAQAKAWNFTGPFFSDQTLKYNCFSSQYNYEKFGFYILNVKLW